MNISRRSLAVVVFAAMTLQLCACSGRPKLAPDVIPQPIEPTTTQRVSAQGFVANQVTEKHYKEVPRGPDVTRTVRVVRRLETAAGFRPGALQVHVLDAGDYVNALTVQSATVVVYKKLLERVKSDTDLAVVISHELGHVLGRHSEDKTLKERSSTVGVVSSIFGTVASVAASAAGYGGLSRTAGSVTQSATGAVGYGAFVGSYSRDQEYEADHLGLLLMAKACFDPEAAPKFWTHAKEIFGHSSGEFQAFFSTHPAASNRSEALNESLPIARKFYADAEKSGACKKR